MNKKASTRVLHGHSVQTIYPTRRPTESKVEEHIHDRHAAREAVPVARTRIFHPFEYWMQGPVGIQYVVEDPSIDSHTGHAIQGRRFKRPVIVLASLHEYARRLFRLVSGP